MEDKKMNGKKLQGAETKRKIIESAVSLFKEYGFENVSVDSIVEKARISKGGFYVHFESKDDLTAALIAEYVNELDLSYGAFLKTFPESAESSSILLSLVDKIADIMTDRIGYNLTKIAYRIQIDRNISTDVLLSYSRDIYGVFSELIQRGIRQGEFREELESEATAEQFVAVLRGFTYEWCIRYPDFHLKDELLRHFNLLLSGIKSKIF
ncbi:TetR/AcrR family transcriptional regulator [Oscillibacter sp.]|uniref:TetR/AcrR family transcriptional regulator n=1 Tax=Oscillibacter sp. TaxID=1945593 RepID=UPI0028963FC3|nr:TetR/AcrR family transcriptional regulator [Oscillibacter sp.]